MRRVHLVSLCVVIVVAVGGATAAWFYAVPPHSVATPYRVEFVQESNCPYGSWLIPWAVEINHQTVVQPSNATLPLSYPTSRLTSNSAYSGISFPLPNGTYSYTVFPNNVNGQEQSGNVTVDGNNVVVIVYTFVTAMGCSSTTTVGG